MPKFSLDHLKKVIPDEHFQNLGYLGVVVFIGGTNFIAYSPLILYAYLIISEVAVGYINQNPNSPIPAFIRPHLQKGVTNKGEYLTLRADLEIYIGIYLMIGWFFGWSSLLSIFFFWQFIRLKNMLNINTQQAFTRFRVKIDGYMNSPSAPGILKTGWVKVKDLMGWFVKFDQPQEGQSPSM